MKQFLTTLLFCLSVSMLVAQAQVEVTGQVKDGPTKKPLEFCSISVFNTKDSLISGSVSNNKGFFKVDLNRGYYRFVLSYLGYKSDTTAVVPVMENKFLGVFKMEQDVNFLKEVTIKTSSRENLLDRDVQVVSDKMREGAANTKEVLDKMNGVDFDRYSNSIKVDNDSKVIILVDGLEKDQEYIKNLSPDRLKKVEVIRDPGGRYALEGYSAVINVILKKDYQGTEIYLSDRNMEDLDASKSEYIPVQNNFSATVNYVYNKLNVYGKYSNNYNNFNLFTIGKKEYVDGTIVERNPPPADGINTKVKQIFNNYTLGADYYVNPKNTVSFESNLATQPWKNNVTNERDNVSVSKNGNVLDSYFSQSKNRSENISTSNSLFYEGKLNENNTFNSNFTYSNYADSYTNEYYERDTYQRIETGENHKDNTRFYFEYFHTFNQKTNLQTGYGNTWEQLDNKYEVEALETKFKYTDTRHKLYSYFSWQLSKKLGVKFGCAGETSAPNANGQKNSYLIFQPYTDIKFSPSGLLDLKLKYRASTNYPDMSQTNPFTYMIDLQSVRIGNPGLRPELTHKVSLQTTILSGLLTIEPYYHFSNNYIAEIGTLRSDGIFEYSYSNAGSYRNYGIQSNFTVPFGKSLFLQPNFDFFKSSISYNGKTNNVNDWSMSCQLIYQNQKSETVAGFQYQNNLRRYISAQGYSKGDNDFWIVFVQQPFFKKKLSVMLLYFTPITWGVDFEQGSYIKTDNYTESRFSNIGFLKNMIMLEISYRFSKGKTVSKKEKAIEDEGGKKPKGLF